MWNIAPIGADQKNQKLPKGQSMVARNELKMSRYLTEAETSEVVEMALSDHVSFSSIKGLYDLSEQDVKTLMRENLKAGSYKAWRKRVKDFSSRREN